MVYVQRTIKEFCVKTVQLQMQLFKGVRWEYIART